MVNESRVLLSDPTTPGTATPTKSHEGVKTCSGQRTSFLHVTGASREGADPLRPHPCRQEPAISPVAVQPRNNHLTGVHLMGVYLTGVHLTGVYLMGVHFIGVYLMGVHLTGVHLMGIHFIRMHLIYESSLRVGHGWRESLYRHPGWLKSF